MLSRVSTAERFNGRAIDLNRPTVQVNRLEPPACATLPVRLLRRHVVLNEREQGRRLRHIATLKASN